MKKNRQRNLRVAFVVPTLGVNTRHILRGICRYAAENLSWHLRIAFDQTERVLPILRKTGVDGAFMALQTPNVMAKATASKIPCIALQCFDIPEKLPYLTAASCDAGRLAAEHFLERGFRHFAYYSMSDLFWARDRMMGFSERLAQAGYTTSVYSTHTKVKPGTKTDWQPGRTWMKGLEGAVQWLHTLSKPVGLMACDDNIAYDLLEVAEEVGIHVPEEVSVVGVYNDETICAAARPPLSSVAIDLEQAGYDAAELLNSIITGRKKPEGRPILAAATHVVARQSSDILAIEDSEVSAAVHFIRTKFNLPIRVADIVKAANSSRRSLQLKFRQHLKRSITEEVTRVRIEYIAKQLLESHMSIDSLAAAAAFDSTSHMIRTFKKHKGVPPRVYRKTHGYV